MGRRAAVSCLPGPMEFIKRKKKKSRIKPTVKKRILLGLKVRLASKATSEWLSSQQEQEPLHRPGGAL